MGGNKFKIGTNHSQPGYWYYFEINSTKRHVKNCFGSKCAYTWTNTDLYPINNLDVSALNKP